MFKKFISTFALALITVGVWLAFKPAVNETIYQDIGRENVEPILSIQGQRYLKQLLDGNYEALSGELEGYLTRPSIDNNIQIKDALFALGRTETWLEVDFNAWVDQSPDLVSPRLMRSNYFLQLGLLARGTDKVINTSRSRMSEMHRFFEKAMADLEVVKSTYSDSPFPYAIELQIAQHIAGKSHREALYKAGMEIDPSFSWLAHIYLWTLAPNWGGSIEQQKDFLFEVSQKIPEYPNFRSVEIDWEISQLNSQRGQYCDKIDDYKQIYSSYENSWSSWQLGRGYSCAGKFEQSIKYLIESLEHWPYRSLTWRLLGSIQHAMGDHEAAYDSTKIAIHLDPYDHFGYFQLAKLAYFFRDYERAEKAFQRAHLMDSEDPKYKAYLLLAQQTQARPSGTHEVVFHKGDLMIREYFTEGRRQQPSKVMASNGALLESKYYEDGNLKFTETWGTGYLNAKFTMRHEKTTGPFWEYSPSGNVVAEGSLYLGEIEGTLNRRLDDGTSLYKIHFKNGKKVGKADFDMQTIQLDGVQFLNITSDQLSSTGTPINSKNTFPFRHDSPIYISSAIDGLGSDENELTYAFYGPDSKKKFEYLVRVVGYDGFNTSYAYYYPNMEEDVPGNWRIDVLWNEHLVSTQAIEVH